VLQAAVIISDYATLMLEILKEKWATTGQRGLWGHGHLG